MPLNILQLSTDLQSDLIRKLPEINLLDLLNDILDKTQEVLKADDCSIYLEDQERDKDGNRRAVMIAANGYSNEWVNIAECPIIPADEVPLWPNEDQRLGITGWVISTGKSLLAQSPEDLVNHPHWSGKYKEMYRGNRDLKLAAFLAVPLRNHRGRVFGVLKAERLVPSNPFSIENQIALEALARVVVRTITYVWDIEKWQNHAAITSWSLDVILEAVATEGELDRFLDTVVKVTAAATKADSCAVFLIDEENKKALTQRAGYGNQVLQKVIRSYRLPDPSQLNCCAESVVCVPLNCLVCQDLVDEKIGLTAWVATTGKSFHARDYQELHEHFHHQGRYDKSNYQGTEICGAWLGIPLIAGGVIVGVLKIENVSHRGIPDRRDFDQEIQQRFDVLGSEIALAIRRLQTQKYVRYQVIQQAIDFLPILRGELAVRPLVEKVVQETAKIFDAKACALFLKEGNQLIQPQWAAYGWAQKGEKVRKYDLIPKEKILETPDENFPKVGLTVWIAVTGKKFTAKSNVELKSHPHWKGKYDGVNFEGDDRCESFMGIPLQVGGKLVGVLKVETKQRKVGEEKEFAYFNEQDELSFELIANSTAIAIQNARLLESRGLAEEIIRQPNENEVMEKLLEFIYGREEVIDTLMSTAEAIQDRNQTRAQIVRSLAELIREDFNLTILDQLTQMINDPFRSLLKFFAEAIHANSVEQISSLNINNLEVDIFLGHDFILKKGVNLLIETSNKIKSQLDQYVANPAHHSSLQNCLDTLISSETSVNELDLFERRVLMRIFKKWHQVIDLEFLKFHEVENPYVAGMPLPAGSPVFVGREEIFRWIQDNLRTKTQKNALVLHGGWHTGKTSILKQLADGPFGERLRKRSNYAIYPVFIDLQELAGRGADIFLFRVAKRISKGLENHGIHIDQPERNDFESKNPYLAFDGILEDIEIQLSKLSDNSLLVIMLDEFELLDDRVREGIIEGDILNYLRSIMQHQPNVTFILAGRHRLDQMTPEFRTRLFNVTLHAKVNLLTKSETEDLICRPVRDYGVTYEDEVIKEILTLTAGHPYFIQQLCYNCISLLNKYCSGYIITHELFEKAIEKAIAENVILPDIWANDLNDDDRSLIRKITLLYNPEISWVSYNDLKYSTEISDEKLSNSLEKLTALQLIEKRISPNSEDNDFRILINLLRLWIEQKQPA